MAINAVKNLTSQLNSAVLSNVGGTDVANTSEAESASTRASSVSLSAATALTTANSKITSNLTAELTRNLSFRNIGSVTDSDAGFRISTAGDYAVAGIMYTKAASSAVFALAGTTLTSSQVVKYLLTLDAAGSGVATQGNIAATSAACSLPATPAGGCPVGQVIVVAGASNCVPGTTTFSQTVSAGGSVVVTELFGVS